MFCTQCGYENTQSAVYCARCGVQLHSTASLNAEPPTEPTQQQVMPPSSNDFNPYAGFWLRVAASIIDSIIVLIAASLLAAGIAAMFTESAETAFLSAYGAYSLFNFIGSWLYSASMESSSYQATFGKWMLGIRVCDLEGQRISFGRASARHFAKFLSSMTLCIGYLMVAFTSKRQGLHDMVCSCLVVHKQAQAQDLGKQPQKTPVGLIIAIAALVMVIPVLGIVAAIAIPAYSDYTQKTKYAEVDHYAQSVTLAVERYYYANNFQVPASLEEAGISQRGQYIKAAHIDKNGIIAFEVAIGSQHGHLLYVPTLDASSNIIWQCESEDIRYGLLPKRCREPQAESNKEVL